MGYIFFLIINDISLKKDLQKLQSQNPSPKNQDIKDYERYELFDFNLHYITQTRNIKIHVSQMMKTGSGGWSEGSLVRRYVGPNMLIRKRSLVPQCDMIAHYYYV